MNPFPDMAARKAPRHTEEKGQSSAGLQFSKVSEDTKLTDGQARLAGKLMGVIELHGAQKDSSGKKTIRELLDAYVPETPALLKEYVCGFGVHGLAVLERYHRALTPKGQTQFEAARQEIESAATK